MDLHLHFKKKTYVSLFPEKGGPLAPLAFFIPKFNNLCGATMPFWCRIPHY